MEVNAGAMGATHTQGAGSILIFNDFNNMRFHFLILTFVVYKLMTTIDALHSTMTNGLKEQDLIKYYTKNADILLEHYTPKEREFDFFASPSTPSDLLESFQARNGIAHSPTMRMDRCWTCSAMMNNAAECEHCGTMKETLDLEPTSIQQSNNRFYHRSTHLNNVLDRLRINLSYPLREKVFARFQQVSHAFQSNKSGRSNMLPYPFVLNKILLELGEEALARQCRPRLSYAKRMEHEGRWEKLIHF